MCPLVLEKIQFQKMSTSIVVLEKISVKKICVFDGPWKREYSEGPLKNYLSRRTLNEYSLKTMLLVDPLLSL